MGELVMASRRHQRRRAAGAASAQLTVEVPERKRRRRGPAGEARVTNNASLTSLADLSGLESVNLLRVTRDGALTSHSLDGLTWLGQDSNSDLYMVTDNSW